MSIQRLHRNHGGYYGETADLERLWCDVNQAARDHGWHSEYFHRTPEFDFLALRRPALAPDAAEVSPRVYISAGIHGDEPAAPLAALRLLQEDQWPANAEIILHPCLNPTGISLNRRDNGQGIDLNRDYLDLQSAEVRAHVAWLEKQPRFDLCLCLHEDWEAHGFYVYELNPDRQPSLAEAIVARVARVCPLDLSSVIEGREAQGGIIRPNLDPHSRPQWPEAFWLLTHKTRLSYTLEAPSDFPLAVRINALAAGVKAALACRLLPSA
ncbi:MAG: M14 family metallocarboxypeptidase [Verrucomicrobia subdivision 3 bacterium]|nr:M14 family metallocarboxypeptidase [Verrucomicrobiota bacterium]MCC6822831.1 M14 family metallocarboxypeptidase [Limisphaerales bacterium]